MGDKNISPWRMWGTSETFRGVTSQLEPGFIAQKQLSLISYGRPESWTFFFAARLLTLNLEPTEEFVHAEFDLSIGVGRSQILMPNFVRLSWLRNAGDNPLLTAFIKPPTLYTTHAAAPVRFQGTLPTSTLTLDEEISDLCSESINVNGRLRYGALMLPGDPPIEVVAELHAYFAPKHHIRPEWFGNEDRGHWGPGSSVPRFPGGEDKGS